MEPVRLVIAGTGFAAAREHLARVGAGAVTVEAVEPGRLRAGGWAAEVLVPTMSRVDAAMLDAVEGLRLVQQFGAGLEGVDVAAATARGIAVANVPTAGTGNAESVAEWCVLAALALSRRLPVLQQEIRDGTRWGGPLGRSLVGRTAGLVGLGGIGQALAARLRPFGMRLLAVKRRPDPEVAARLGLEWLGGPDALPELLRRSDYLFLCVPLTAETRALLDERALALLPPDACVVNPGRGGLVSEGALLAALSAGRLLGAGLDVFEHEPLDPASPLLGRPDLLATPHVAGVTDLSYLGIATRVVENAVRVARGEPPRCCVNPEALRGAPTASGPRPS